MSNKSSTKGFFDSLQDDILRIYSPGQSSQNLGNLGPVQPPEPEIPIAKQQASGQEPEEGEGNSRVLLVTYIDGSKSKIFLSPEDKLTFGPSIPGLKNSYGPSEYALRIYRGNKETGLRAAFPGVRCFHESTITILPW